MTDESLLARAAGLIRSHPAVALVCHESPDGDALGSVIGLSRALADGGWDVYAWVPGSTPLPPDYAWLGFEHLARVPPEDLDGRLLITLDCGSALRLGEEGERILEQAAASLNLDHHADNTRFGDLPVVDADLPCTTILVRRLLPHLEVPLDEPIALPLYVGLVTDTGSFAYANTDAGAHLEAALLIEAGVRPAEVSRVLYEGNPEPRVRLLGRALERLEVRAEGRLAMTWVTRADLEELGAAETDTEGIVNHLRGIAGVRVAAFLREPLDRGRGRWKGSLRAASPTVDVARIAHTFGGGGHRQAAGFSTEDDLESTIRRLEEASTFGA